MKAPWSDYWNTDEFYKGWIRMHYKFAIVFFGALLLNIGTLYLNLILHNTFNDFMALISVAAIIFCLERIYNCLFVRIPEVKKSWVRMKESEAKLDELEAKIGR